MNEFPTVPKPFSDLIDQVFEIEKKQAAINEPNSIGRNIKRIKEILENWTPNEGLIYQNPLGENYNETRLDLEAEIAGESTDDLIVTEVIKPIIRLRTNRATTIARKGIVIVESKNNNKNIKTTTL
jgi:hypothetical protein